MTTTHNTIHRRSDRPTHDTVFTVGKQQPFRMRVEEWCQTVARYQAKEGLERVGISEHVMTVWLGNTVDVPSASFKNQNHFLN